MEGFVVFLVIVVSLVCIIIKAISDQKLLEKNPQAWAAKKLIEEEVKHRKRQSHASIGMQIARIFLPK